MMERLATELLSKRTGLVAAWMQSKVNECRDCVDMVLTCEGDYYDPNFPFQLKCFNQKLLQILHADKDKLTIKKVEPWNSVKVTLNIPREAAIRLKTLAEEGNEALRNIGVLAVQVEGDRVISMTFRGRDDETAQVHFGSNSCLGTDHTPPVVSSSHVQHKSPVATVLSGHFLKPKSAETTAIAMRSNGSLELPQTFSNGLPFTCHPTITPRLVTAPTATVATAVRQTSHVMTAGSMDTTLDAVVAAAVAISPRNSLTCPGRLPVSTRSSAPKAKRIRKKKEPAVPVSVNQSMADIRAVERAEQQQGSSTHHLPSGFQRSPAYTLPSTGAELLTNGGPLPSSSAQNGCTQLSSRNLLETGKGELISANESIKAINDIITSLSASPSHHVLVHHQAIRPNLSKSSNGHGSHATSLSVPVLSCASASGSKSHVSVIVKDIPTRPSYCGDMTDPNGCSAAGSSKCTLLPAAADMTGESAGQHTYESASPRLSHVLAEAAAAESNKTGSYSQRQPLLLQPQPLPSPPPEKPSVEAHHLDRSIVSSATLRIPPVGQVVPFKSPASPHRLDVDGPAARDPDNSSSNGCLLLASCAVPASLASCPASLDADAASSATDHICISAKGLVASDEVASDEAGSVAATDTAATVGKTQEPSSLRGLIAGSSSSRSLDRVLQNAPLNVARGSVSQLIPVVAAPGTLDTSQPAESRTAIVEWNAHPQPSEVVHTRGSFDVSSTAHTAAVCSPQTQSRLGLSAEEAPVVSAATDCGLAYASASLPVAMADIPVSVACVAQRADEGNVDGASLSLAARSSSDGLPPGDVFCTELVKIAVVIPDEKCLRAHPSGDGVVQLNEAPAVPCDDAQRCSQLETRDTEERLTEGEPPPTNEGSLLYSRPCIRSTPGGLHEAFHDHCRAPETAEMPLQASATDSQASATTGLLPSSVSGSTSDGHSELLRVHVSAASYTSIAAPLLTEHTEAAANCQPSAVLAALPVTVQSPSCAPGAESPEGFERCMHGLHSEGESCSRCEASPGTVASASACATDGSSAGDCSAAAADPTIVLDLSSPAGPSAQPFSVEDSERKGVCMSRLLDSTGSVELALAHGSPEQAASDERLSSIMSLEELSSNGILQSLPEREQDTGRGLQQQLEADGDGRRPSSESAESGISLDECSSELLPIIEPLAAGSGTSLVQQAVADPHDEEGADAEPSNSDASEKIEPCGLPFAAARLPSDRLSQRSTAGRGRPRGGAKRTYLLTIESNNAEVIIGDAVVDTGRLSIGESDSSEPKPKGRRGRKAQEFTRNGALLSPVSATQFEPAKRSTRSHGAADLQALPTVYRERRKPLDKK